MTTHACSYETITARHPGAAGLPNGHAWSAQYPVISISGDDAYLIPYPLVPPSGYQAIPVAQATLYENGDVLFYTLAQSGHPRIIQNGAAIDNGTSFLVTAQSFSAINSGRLAPRIAMDFSGSAAHPANPSDMSGHVLYAYQDNTYQGQCHFCEFEDDPPNTQTDPNARLAELLYGFVNGGSQYQAGVNSVATPIMINHCAFAGLAPEGAVYVRPEDIGDGPDKIPTATADNTAAKFRAHPSVFYPAGKGGYVRSVFRQAKDDLALSNETAAGSGGPIGITTVDSAPVTSNWLVSVDGQTQIVQLNHPAGSDHRRPRDIWNNVWVPILQGGSSVAQATLFGGVVSNGGSIAFRWNYADYFRCLPLNGSNVFQTVPG